MICEEHLNLSLTLKKDSATQSQFVRCRDIELEENWGTHSSSEEGDLKF